MLAHKDRFDDAMMRHFSETVAGMPPASDSAKVRHGIEEALPPAIFERMNAIWAEQITGPLGFADFAEDLTHRYRSASAEEDANA